MIQMRLQDLDLNGYSNSPEVPVKTKGSAGAARAEPAFPDFADLLQHISTKAPWQQSSTAVKEEESEWAAEEVTSSESEGAYYCSPEPGELLCPDCRASWQFEAAIRYLHAFGVRHQQLR